MTGQDIEVARVLLARLGISAEDLLGPRTGESRPPTFGEYIPKVRRTVKDGTLRTYSSYWRRIENAWAERKITDPSALEIRQLVEDTRRQAITRRNSRGGRSAAEHMLGALRYLYRCAGADGYLPTTNNPADGVEKPRRLPNSRRALTDLQLKAINHVTTTTGNDTELDTLINRLHLETACRRGGALALRPDDLDAEQCLVRLREKGETIRWQPVSPTLMQNLLTHRERGAGPDDQLLRYRNGRAITGRRYDYIWTRIGRHLPWVATQQVTAHWLRYTTLTWVERHFGYAVAREFAGHTDTGGNIGATYTYVRASLYEVAEALSVLTGEPHPLSHAALPQRGPQPAPLRTE
ncbi:site-specific integrase [Nocardia sp. NPDC050435]|uniref:tyrosine-type recombinase/integrase n=1 Tax=Nocardia sp. NPDC050435 TaxID=3155040 RepID=UPI0033FE7AA1